MRTMKINELLKEIRDNRREENILFRREFLNKELANGAGLKFEKQLKDKGKAFYLQFNEKIEGDYFPILQEKREELENMALKFMEENNIKKSDVFRGLHTMSPEEFYIELWYTISYTALETDEEFNSRVNSLILKDFKNLYVNPEPYELFENLVVVDGDFSIVYKNVEYKYHIKSDKFLKKTISIEDSKELYQLIISSAQSIECVGITEL